MVIHELELCDTEDINYKGLQGCIGWDSRNYIWVLMPFLPKVHPMLRWNGIWKWNFNLWHCCKIYNFLPWKNFLPFVSFIIFKNLRGGGCPPPYLTLVLEHLWCSNFVRLFSVLSRVENMGHYPDLVPGSRLNDVTRKSVSDVIKTVVFYILTSMTSLMTS